MSFVLNFMMDFQEVMINLCKFHLLFLSLKLLFSSHLPCQSISIELATILTRNLLHFSLYLRFFFIFQLHSSCKSLILLSCLSSNIKKIEQIRWIAHPFMFCSVFLSHIVLCNIYRSSTTSPDKYIKRLKIFRHSVCFMWIITKEGIRKIRLNKIK